MDMCKLAYMGCYGQGISRAKLRVVGLGILQGTIPLPGPVMKHNKALIIRMLAILLQVGQITVVSSRAFGMLITWKGTSSGMQEESQSQPDKVASRGLAQRLLRDHEDFIWSVIHLHTQDQHNAQDLFQGLFLSVLVKPFPRDLSDSEIRRYLYRAITNDFIDSQRRQGRYRLQIHRHYVEKSRALRDDGNPEKVVIKNEDANLRAHHMSMILELIAKHLPERMARAIQLRYLNDLSVDETAKSMNVSPRSISSYVSAGLNRIRRLYPKRKAGADHDE